MSNKNNSRKYIDAKQIRRRRFNVPLVVLYSLMFAVPYVIFVISWGIGKIDSYAWPSTLWTSVGIFFVLSLPFLILRMLNNRFFGKIICTLTEEGIYYPKGMIRWGTIEKIEYDMNSKPKFESDIAKSFRLIVYTKGGKHIVVADAPVGIVTNIKKYQKEIDIKFTGVQSLLCVIFVVAAIVLVLPLYVLLLCIAPGIPVVKLVVWVAIWVVLSIIRIPIFDKYAVAYRFWRKILPKKWLSYIILWVYYLSYFVIILILFYFPNWFSVSVLGIYMGVIQPPVPHRHGSARFYNNLSYEKLYDTYINRADFWERKIKENERRQHPNQ